MKNLIFILFAICLFSCSEPKVTGTVLSSNGTTVEIVTIDGCQYIKNETYGIGRYVYTHKGNCNNPFHRRNIVLKYNNN